MNESKTSCASTDQKWSTWESIDWNKCDCKSSESRQTRQGESFAVDADAFVLR